MIDKLEISPEERQSSRQEASGLPEKTVTVALPADLAAVLDQHMARLGQTAAQVILEALRSALSLPSSAVEAHAPGLNSAYPSEAAARFQALHARLAKLESLIPRLEVLEGK